MPISKWLEGRRRMVALAVMNVCFAVASLGILIGGTLFEGATAALVMIGATLIFAVGECLQGPDPGCARRRHGAVPPQRALLRALEHVLEHRRDPRARRSAGRCSAGSRTPSGRSRHARACLPARAASRWNGVCRPSFAVLLVSHRTFAPARAEGVPPARAGRMRRMSTPILDDPLSTDAEPASHQASAAAAACRERRSGSAPAR